LIDLRVLVTPSQLKKFVTGKGNADKSVVMKEVYKRFSIDTDDDNTADAVVLGHIGMTLISAYQTTNQDQASIIADIRKRHAVLVPAVAA
jgi:crossover junction endodeoxyribonuclease RuvC